jgi:hypothetical protein
MSSKSSRSSGAPESIVDKRSKNDGFGRMDSASLIAVNEKWNTYSFYAPSTAVQPFARNSA